MAKSKGGHHCKVPLQPRSVLHDSLIAMEPTLAKRSYKMTNHQQVSLVVVPTVFTALAVLFTGLRIYGRRLKNAKQGVDDYLCILACILALALLGGDIAMVVAAGGGTSVMSLKNPNDLFLWLKLLIITYLIWCAAIAVVQLAILFLYQRLFSVVTWFRRACYIAMGLVFGWFIAAWASDLAICNPTRKVWDPRERVETGS
ncbi:integral membrane [Pyrenophora seminiperda CCB06]|uniref:Integral membrane n=1 Tax=Pyrenophora seminiperda CCB06 TaxID=1302712 RepID=A0A3M7LVP9_9PLEO|nr:integral membrane [Pyrenophora seminiperda CCB06]